MFDPKMVFMLVMFVGTEILTDYFRLNKES